SSAARRAAAWGASSPTATAGCRSGSPCGTSPAHCRSCVNAPLPPAAIRTRSRSRSSGPRATPTRSERTATWASPAASSPCPPPAATRSCRCSTATRRWSISCAADGARRQVRRRLSAQSDPQLLRHDVPVQEPRWPIRDVMWLEKLRVEPLDEGRVAQSLGILAQVGRHHRQQLEAFVEREAGGLVVDLAVDHLDDIVGCRHPAGIPVVAPQAGAATDAREAEPLDQLAACGIELAAD